VVSLPPQLRPEPSRFYQLKTGHCLSGQYLHWTKNRAKPQCWRCRYQNQTREHLFKECPEWKAQQEILRAEVQKETGRWKSWWKIQDLLADERCSQAVLDFLNATDVGRRVLAEESEGSGASEWELRERREREEEREAETLGAADEMGALEEQPLFLPTPSFMASAGEDYIGDGARFPFVLAFALSFLTFLGAYLHFLGTVLGGGQPGACNVPPPRGQRTSRLCGGLEQVSP